MIEIRVTSPVRKVFKSKTEFATWLGLSKTNMQWLLRRYTPNEIANRYIKGGGGNSRSKKVDE